MKFLLSLWSDWLRVAHRIGVFQSRIILTLFYFTIFLPFGLLFSLLSDPLGVKVKKRTAWTDKNTQDGNMTQLLEQF